MMQIYSIWNRWIDHLAAVVVRVREAWRARRALVIAREETRFVIRQAPALRQADSAGAASNAEGSSARALAAAARGCFVTLDLAAEEFVSQRIQVPAQAREFLTGIVRNQIDLLSPWPSAQALFGFDAEVCRQDAALLDVRVAMISRARVEAMRGELTALGVEVDQVTAREPNAGDNPPIVLWSRFEREPGTESGRRPIIMAVLALLAVSLGLSAWALASAAAVNTASDEVAERSAQVQRQFELGHTGNAALSPSEVAWNEKANSPAAVLILEALSRGFPDTAYITELSLQKSTLRLIGLTTDAPSLLAPLEQSGQFTGAHFFAPTTRGPDGALYWFHIEAQVVPHFDLPEK